MAREYIESEDLLNTGRKKLNRSIDKSYDAEETSVQALKDANALGNQAINDANKLGNESLLIANTSNLKADEAVKKSEITDKKLETLVIESGTSDAEVIIAREDIQGKIHESLGKRIDEIERKSEIKKTVRYEEFGINTKPKFYNALTDKYYLDKEFNEEYLIDDAPILKKIHQEIIENNLTIDDKNCHFVLKSCVGIPIPENYSNVGGVFHVDSKALVKDFAIANSMLFPVSTVTQGFKSISDINIIKKIHSKLSKNKKVDFSEFEFLKNKLVIVKDVNDVVGIRSKYGEGSYKKTDFFITDSNGISISDCGWDFNNITDVTFKSVDTHYSEINLGTIALNNNLAYGKLKNPVFESSRSRIKLTVNVLIENGVEQSENDAHSNGTIYFKDGGLVEINDSELTPCKLIRNEKGETVSSYTLGAYNIDGLKLKNVKAVGNLEQGFWGFMGSNFIKNLETIDSNVNRIDVHFYLRNITGRNTEIGDFGILFAGSGIAKFDNINSNSFTVIQTRDDYGCYWDGDIIIENLNWSIPKNGMKTTEANLVSFSDVLNVDHGYDFIFGRNIYIEKVNINFNEPNESIYLNLVRNTYNKTLNARQVYYPDNIIVKQVKINGRKTGVNQYLAIKDPENAANYSKDKNIYYNQRHFVNVLKHNANYIFEDVDTLNKDADNTNQLDACIRLMTSDVSKYTENSLLPKITLEGISQVYLAPNRARADIEVNNSDTSLVVGYFGGDALSCVRLNGGSIQPDLAKLTDVIQMTGGLFEMNGVTVKPIKISGNVNLDDTMSKLGFFTAVANATAVTFKYGNYTGVDLDPRILSHMDSFATKAATDKVFSELKSNRLTRYWEATGNGYTI
ncbi:hypothetical protein [Vagococcus fluvialis]|uniref:Uncharacterized protein n=1 Tax=Vagococcus fluvialis TaxID=2738 RepID=A0A7X6D808_9ENTE|nr:hypothetical protein [Vagococcus fluvialis]NKC67173.1 hypothetical protein [Vagococcus fluvialis]